MATWVTHLMIADGVLRRFPGLDRRGFCVGNIAPDCNVENEDWTAFTPSREVTHWMQGERKKATDCDAFCDEYIIRRFADINSNEQYSFLLGYYAHLITDAAFQAMIRNEDRVKAAWGRIKADAELCKSSAGMEETWDAIKKLVPKRERMRQIYVMEAEYLRDHPDSGYLTEILTLKEFPDYIDYLPTGAIVRKIGAMGYLPKLDESVPKFIAMSREEYAAFVNDTIRLVVEQFTEKRLLQNLQERYQPFVDAHLIGTVRNCFLMPTSSTDIIEKGTASLAILSNLGLQDIQVRLLPAVEVYDYYLSDRKIDISLLSL